MLFVADSASFVNAATPPPFVCTCGKPLRIIILGSRFLLFIFRYLITAICLITDIAFIGKKIRMVCRDPRSGDAGAALFVFS